jgi:cytochrome b6-f complex iron-sulfur subunit
MESSSRRTFLVASLGALGVAGLGAVLYPLLSYLAPSKSAGSKQSVTLKLSEIPEGGAKFFDLNGAAGVIIKLKDGNLAAFSAVCTHLGCIIQWQKDQYKFVCPCHGGQFSTEGAVLGGPPPKPLAKLAFAVTGDSVTIG